MSRKAVISKKAVVSHEEKFINNLMYSGKKSIASKAFSSAISRIRQSKSLESFEDINAKSSDSEILAKILEMSCPSVEIRSIRVGGSNYQVAIVIKGTEKAIHRSIKFVVKAIRSKKNDSIENKVYNVFEDNLNRRGEAVKEKDRIEAVAEANRAYSHFANLSKKRKKQ
jgi:small subunit ribosomal protein S7